MTRIARAWDALSRDQRLAAIAALTLLLAMFLPWYQQNAVDRSGLVSSDLNAFAVFSFAEAVILLTVIAVLAVLFARAERRTLPVQLPGSDGALVMAAGIWSSLLLTLRLFDKPGVSTSGVANVGVQWGIFLALAAAGTLAYAGSRMRAAGNAATAPDTGAGGGSRREGRSGRPAARRRRDASGRGRAASPSWLEVPPWVPAPGATAGSAQTAHRAPGDRRDGAAGETRGAGVARTHAGRRAQRSKAADPAHEHQQLSLEQDGEDTLTPQPPPD